MSEAPKQEQRAFLAIALAMGVLLTWNLIFPVRPPRPAPGSTVPGSEVAAPTPTSGPAGSPSSSAPSSAPGADPSPMPAIGGAGDGILALPDSSSVVDRVRVVLENPDLAIEVDGLGARVTRATLPAFQEADGEPVQLLPEPGAGALGTVLELAGQRVSIDGETFRLVSDSGPSSETGRIVVWELERQGLVLRKRFTLPPTGNLLTVEQEILREPQALSKWGLAWGGGLRRTEEMKGKTPPGYFQGSVLAEGKVQKKPSNALSKGPAEFAGQTYFVGVQNKYFLGAIVPRGDSQGPARLWRVDDGRTPPEDAPVAGEIVNLRTPGVAANAIVHDVYVGPLDFEKLTALGLGIEGAVDLGYAWIRPLSELLLKLMIGLHNVVPNYGVVIILFSMLISLVFFPLTYKSAKSMRDRAALKPRLDALKQKHSQDPQKLSEATMKLYKEAGVNPFGGCFPLLLQMPIFFALYAVLFHTIELRGAPFFGWITDLSQPDVIFSLPFAIPLIGSGIAVLPIIMGVTSYIQSKQTVVDPSQKMMTVLMPVVMTFVFFSFPSGLVLYWLTNNVIMILQKVMMKPSPLASMPAGS